MNDEKKMRVAVAGATGYSGQELVKLLMRHGHVEVVCLAHGPGRADAPLSDTFPELAGVCDMTVVGIPALLDCKDVDVAFLALPHCAVMAVAKPLLARGVRVVDFSADYRLRDVETYEKWYGVTHEDKENLAHAVYGLCEHYRAEIRNARLIANPGCYPTGALLALIPLLKAEVIEPENIIIDAKSGATGAGRKVSDALHFCEVNESFKAYKVFSHRHTPEIDQELSETAGVRVKVVFTPHLLPVQRGILSTIYVDLKRRKTSNDIAHAFEDAYGDEFFVRVRSEGSGVELRHVVNTNFCDINFFVSGGKVILTSAIDNLTKGAAGQALQNFNIMCGFPETEGLI